MIWLPVLVASGVLYAGGKSIPTLTQHAKAWLKRRTEQPALPSKGIQAERDVTLSAVSLGAATTGSVLHIAVLGWISAPISIYLLLPVLREAKQVIWHERRINDQVLTGVRLAVCMCMNYTFIAALDACLHTLTQRLQTHHHQQWQHACQQQLGDAALPWLQHWEHELAKKPTTWQQWGERSGALAAPAMLITCALTTSALGIACSSAFLTTFFGAHVHKLSPYTTQEMLQRAFDQHLFITNARALIQAQHTDTVIFAAQVVRNHQFNPQLAIVLQTLQQQGMQVYVWWDRTTDSLPAGFDAHVIADNEREEWLKQWQTTGKPLCYVHDTNSKPDPELAAAWHVCLRFPPTDGDLCASADVFLPSNHLHALPQLFALSAAFNQRQRFNLLAPIGVDVIDIASTLLLDFGLVYSVMFTYVGQLLSMYRTHWQAPELTNQHTLVTDLQLPSTEKLC